MGVPSAPPPHPARTALARFLGVFAWLATTLPLLVAQYWILAVSATLIAGGVALLPWGLSQARHVGESPTPTPTNAAAGTSQQAMPSSRVLSENERQTLRINLSGLQGHKIAVYADMTDGESNKFAYQFFEVFKALGIDTGQGIGRGVYSIPLAPVGVFCYTQLPINENAPEIRDAITLRNALISAKLMDPGLKIHVEAANHMHLGEPVQLVVGPR